MDFEQFDKSATVVRVGRSGTRSTNRTHLDVFVLSEAGKPIYCYNRRPDAITLLPLCQALVSYFADSHSDNLRSVHTRSGLRICFSVKSPLIVVAVVHPASGVDSSLLVSQVHAQIVSVLTGQTLRSVFDQSATFDLRRLLTGSDKMLDQLIESALVDRSLYNIGRPRSNAINDVDVVRHFLSSVIQPFPNPTKQGMLSLASTLSQTPSVYKPHLNRALVPLTPMIQSLREQFQNMLLSSVSSTGNTDVLFSLLLQLHPVDGVNGDSDRVDNNQFDLEVIVIVNHQVKLAKLCPLDVHLLLNLLRASQAQILSVESLWLPICLPRFNNTAFVHAHISQLLKDTESNKLALVLITTSKNDFEKCQKTKCLIEERTHRLAPQLLPTASQSGTFNDLPVAGLHLFWYQSVRPQTIVWKSSNCGHEALCRFDHLMHAIAARMISSQLKTMWIRSDQHCVAILGWHSPSFQLYIQFDVTTTQTHALNAAQLIIKYVKKEEERMFLKDYQ